MNFEPTKEQVKAFKKVSKSIKDAKKLGLVFYGKSHNLVAYTKDANDYIEEDFEGSLGTGFPQITCISESGLLDDSGADDYGSFRSLEDFRKYN